MNGLSLSMWCSLSAPICNVFNYIINRIVRSACHDDLPLLNYILNQTVVPDDAFKWIAQSKRSNVDLISYLIKRRLWWDKQIDSIVNILEKTDRNFQSCTQIDKLLEENRIHLSIYEKHYLFALLTGEKSSDPLEKILLQDKIYDCNASFPVVAISERYIPTADLIEEAFCETARLADHKMLKNIIRAAEENHLHCDFDPEYDSDHKEVLSWLQKNIVRGCSGDKKLGWTDGPDSVKWPSTELKDYVKTLDCLYEIMC